MPATASILTSIKEALGQTADYTAFDQELIMHVNAALSNLTQLGIGPESGFAITGANETWTQFMGTDSRRNSAQQYVYLSVRLAFDPPSIGYVLTSLENLKAEAAWRLTVVADEPASILTSGRTRIVGNEGDAHTIRLDNPSGQTLISSSGQYEAMFYAEGDEDGVPVALDISELVDGVLKLPIIIETGTYKIWLVEPRRTLLVAEVVAV